MPAKRGQLLLDPLEDQLVGEALHVTLAQALAALELALNLLQRLGLQQGRRRR